MLQGRTEGLRVSQEPGRKQETCGGGEFRKRMQQGPAARLGEVAGPVTPAQAHIIAQRCPPGSWVTLPTLTRAPTKSFLFTPLAFLIYKMTWDSSWHFGGYSINATCDQQP